MLVLQMSLHLFPWPLPCHTSLQPEFSTLQGLDLGQKPLGFQLGTKKVIQRQPQSETLNQVNNQTHLSWTRSPGVATSLPSLGFLIWKREAKCQLHMGCVASEGI